MQMPRLLHSNVTVVFSKMSNVLFVCVLGGGGGEGGVGPCFVCLFFGFHEEQPTVCKLFPLFLFHPFHSFILPLPHITHLHFTKILKKS